PPLFFFSSRRRHTRFSRDWSSDVCSSDLRTALHDFRGRTMRHPTRRRALTAALAGIVAATVALTPLLADARAGRGGSFGSRGTRSEERRVGKEGSSRWWPWT